MAANEPNFDISDLKLQGGTTVRDVRGSITDALMEGVSFDTPEDEAQVADYLRDGVAAERDAEPQDEDVDEVQDVEAEAEAEVDSEADEDAADEEGAEETDEIDYPMPELLTFEGEEAGIEIDGEFRSLQSLKEDGLRQSEFSRRLSELSDSRKAIQSEAQAVAEARQAYINALDQIQTYIESQVAPQRSPEEMARLKAEDPKRYTAELEAQTEARKAIEKLEADRRIAAEEAQRTTSAARQRALEDLDTQLRTTIPGWSDPETMQSEAEDMVGWLTERFSMSPQERANMIDPRFWEIAYLAWDGQRLREGAEQVREKAKPRPKKVLRAGRKVPESEKVKRADRPLVDGLDRLQRTGDFKTARDVFAEGVARGAFD